MTQDPQEMGIVPVSHDTVAVELWGTSNPRGMTARMGEIADAIKDVLVQRGLTQQIGDNQYVRVEGWSMTGAMLGVFPRTSTVECTEYGEIEPEELEKRGRNGTYIKRLPYVAGALTFKAVVELVARDGLVVGGAISYCSKHEEQFRDREDNQVASMAQTRATAKAFRQSFGFVMPMAGYAATPAEEMDTGVIDAAFVERGGAQPRQERTQRAEGRPVAQPGGERRNGVVAPPEQLKNVGHLIAYARYHHGLTQQEAADRLGVDAVADITGLVRDRYAGDYNAAARAIDAAVAGVQAPPVQDAGVPVCRVCSDFAGEFVEADLCASCAKKMVDRGERPA